VKNQFGVAISNALRHRMLLRAAVRDLGKFGVVGIEQDQGDLTRGGADLSTADADLAVIKAVHEKSLLLKHHSLPSWASDYRLRHHWSNHLYQKT
jgi:hypothetical protein